MNIIDKTYNGHKYPIIERDYNAYFFPDNYDPENSDDYVQAQSNAADVHQQIVTYSPEDVVD